MIELLNFIQQELNNAGIPYEFERWTDAVSYPYFVGETSPVEPMNEDGMEETTFILTGWNRSDLYPLYLISEKIRNIFPPVGGKTAILESGSGIAVFFADAFPIDSGEEDLRKIQINLTVKTWKVN